MSLSLGCVCVCVCVCVCADCLISLLFAKYMYYVGLITYQGTKCVCFIHYQSTLSLVSSIDVTWTKI